MTPDEMELAERCHTDSCDHVRDLREALGAVETEMEFIADHLDVPRHDVSSPATDPRPEVVALAEAMLSADPDYQRAAEMILRHLPAPFAIVDMDALTERVREGLSRYWIKAGVGHDDVNYRTEARRLIGEA